VIDFINQIVSWLAPVTKYVLIAFKDAWKMRDMHIYQDELLVYLEHENLLGLGGTRDLALRNGVAGIPTADRF